MELLCYLYEGWNPRIRPASQRRDWMDATPEAFAYRCLPLNIANAHGWEILAPCGFEAEWNGGAGADDVVITPDAGTEPHDHPVALFGQGTFTFHIQALFRTPPGWNLWVGGPPNGMRDGVAPLGGVIETDWSPYTFTMNWRFTRPNQRVRFEAGDVICHLFPVQRDVIDGVEPRFLPIESEPELKAAFEAWSRSRDAFQIEVERNPPTRPAEKWQKLYYRGVMPDGSPGPQDHHSKLRPRAFTQGQGSAAVCPVSVPPATPPRSVVDTGTATTLAKRDWMLHAQSRMRSLSPRADGLFRYEGLTPQAFLDEFYAANRPVVLGGAAAAWPSSGRWTPDYLRQAVGAATVEVQARRASDSEYERNKDAHKETMPFDAFMDQAATPGADVYLTAYNASSNHQALAPLQADLGRLDGILDAQGAAAGMMWIGPQGTFTPLHHDLTNNVLFQITGRKRVVLVAPSETPKLYNDRHVFSEIKDITDPALDFDRFPLARGIKVQTLVLEPGDALFIPVGWWHQVRSLDFSVSLTCTNFTWPNDVWEAYPPD